jgi:glycosyltransferase involved in cell wall biosynthesis
LKNILFVSHSSYSTGGAENDFERLLSYFSNLNGKYDIHCLLPYSEGIKIYTRYCNESGIIREGVFPTYWCNLMDYIKYVIKGFIQVNEIRKFIKNKNFDLIILNVSVLIIPAIYFKFKKQKIIVFIREYIKPDIFRKLIYKILSKTSIYLFAVSNLLKKDYVEITNTDNISTVYSAIENQKNDFIQNNKIIYENIDKKICNLLFSSRFKLLNIGPVCKLKNQILIIEALNRIKTKGLDVPIFISIGDFNKNSKYVRKITELINTYDLNEYCYFLGNLNKTITHNILNIASTLIISSLSEGMPLVMVEAMKFGVPLIATNVGGIPEIIKNSFNGLLINPDSTELEDAILKIIPDDNLKNNLIKNAKIFEDKYFNLEKNLIEIESIVEKIF